MREGNFCVQHVTQSENPSLGQFPMQEATSLPSSPPVQELPPPHLAVHSSTQILKTAGSSPGQPETHAANDPPGQPGVGDGLGVGFGAGEGGGVGGGVGDGRSKVPLVTQPPHSSSRGESTALFNQHSLFS